MAKLKITNLTARPVLVQELYTTVQPNGTIETTRSAADVERMTGFLTSVAEGSLSYTLEMSEVEKKVAKAVKVTDEAPLPPPGVLTAGDPDRQAEALRRDELLRERAELHRAEDPRRPAGVLNADAKPAKSEKAAVKSDKADKSDKSDKSDK